ncbi:DegT/DnrJ/EryC1/StrS family aminotransferase [Maribacter cobaltidurans]|uniref:L-glutamine--2-deoxy-scyllo-inosose aminotransferase KanB n=1 Tax=Maribacter cobaltidurans TaxID=1178778 RepID=A0A223V1F8_9FLAO|nr:DegT/DnrJ/EryC1/StrS family aminotransferase [Maribacter cobaltidurans]ASV28749.1 L-glutamine--2-deoxy-scyllo-inosose aminotransferase KanB [Maribacter cobaltidurans]GGD75122.1 8-amino-3,8-dideoxy-alpha-D-manno-octulosonate transaminase [Maribacter cobaltidurans]
MPGFELFGDKEKKSVQDVLDTGVLMRYGFDGARKGHWKGKELEGALCERMESKYAQVVSSGTAALTVALASAGVGAGDEVILPTFTFVASFESVLAIGAVPILVDVDDTLTLSPLTVERAITPKTKVVMPVHMCGSMADLKALKALCDSHNLILLEDACQAIGGSFEGKPLGSYGDLGCFSFDYVKTITCGEGGALITNNPDFYKNADHYSDHGHDHVGSNRGAESHPFLGYNYRISELNAAVGCAQIQRLDEFVGIQEKNYNILFDALKNIDGVTFRRIPKGGIQNYSFLNFFLPTEDLTRRAHQAFGDGGVDACFYWYDNNWHYYRKWEHLTNLTSLGKLPNEVQKNLPDYSKSDFSASDKWISRTISCLIKLSWTETEVQERAKKMATIIKEVLKS